MDKKCEKKLKKTHFCERCNFTSNNKTDYDRHCKTQKHIYGLDNLDNKWITEKTRKNASSFSCECGSGQEIDKQTDCHAGRFSAFISSWCYGSHWRT